MKKRINGSYLKFNLIFIFFICLIFWTLYLYNDYMKSEEILKSNRKAGKLLENYIEMKAINLKKNSERYHEYGVIDKGEFDYLFSEKNKIWKLYNALEKKWEKIELNGVEKMYTGENKGIINYNEKYYIYGGVLKGTSAVFSAWEINQNFFDIFSKNTGIDISLVEEEANYYLENSDEEISLGVYFETEDFGIWKDKVLSVYVAMLFLLILSFSYFLKIKITSIEGRILEDISIIRESQGKHEIEVEDKLDFYRVKVALMKLGKSFCKRNNEVYKLKGELTKTNLELRELAIMDKLTGLYNKRFLYEMLENLKKEEVEAPYHNIVMMIDLDNFKRLNDTSGHVEGDSLLQALGGILKDMGKGWGTAFRYGGDEFLIIFKKVKYEDFLDIVSEFELAKKNITVRYLDIKLGISAGVMMLDDVNNYDPDILIKKVDELLYEAKKNGKDQIIFKV